MDNFLWTKSDTETGGFGHVPVLLREVLSALSPRAGGIYIDGTFGGGGYARAIIEATSSKAAPCRVVGFDRDPDAIAHAEPWIGNWPSITLLHSTFGEMAEAYNAIEQARPDGIVLDLGVSSFQLDQAERGFSLQHSGPLDMRMSRSGPSAADLVNELGQDALADLIYLYGDERQSRRIARAIIRERQKSAIDDTGRLASIVAGAVRSPKGGHQRTHPATRTFQALRIAVNDELGELERALSAAETLLADGGKLVVVSFHSGEDRIVKRFIDQRSGRQPSASRHLPATADALAPQAPSFRPVSRKPVEPGEAELAANPRARSARLRAAIRVRSERGIERHEEDQADHRSAPRWIDPSNDPKQETSPRTSSLNSLTAIIHANDPTRRAA